MTRLASFTLLALLLGGDALAAPKHVALALVAPGLAESVRAQAQRQLFDSLPTEGGLIIEVHRRCGPPFDGPCLSEVATAWGAQLVFAAWVERSEDVCAASFVVADAAGKLLRNGTKIVECGGADLGDALADMAVPPEVKAERRRAAIQQEADSKGILALIGAKGDSSSGSVADVFGDGEGAQDVALEDALAGVGGVRTAAPGAVEGSDGGAAPPPPPPAPPAPSAAPPGSPEPPADTGGAAGIGGLGLRGGGSGGGGRGAGSVGLGAVASPKGKEAERREVKRKRKRKKKKKKRKKKDADKKRSSGRADGAPPAAPSPEAAPEEEAEEVEAEADSQVSVARFPTVESPSRVVPGNKFAVQVSLTEDEITPEVVIRSGPSDSSGRLLLALPARAEGWAIDVILSAPGFEVVGGGNTGAIRLPKSGDSTPAMFQLVAEDVPAPKERKLYVTFWHEGAYLAKVVRPVLVASAQAVIASKADTARPRSTGAPTVTPGGQIVAPDLTVWLTRVTDPSRPDTVTTVLQLNSPYLQPQTHTIAHAPVSAAWLRSKYSRLAPKAARGVNVGGAGAAAPSSAQTRIDRMVGFGRVVWDKLAPQAFRDAFWALRDKRGDQFRSLQIFTNDPALPWELMRPARTGRDGRTEELDFLGMVLDIGRWHVVTRSRGQLDRPPQRSALSHIHAIAPEYPSAQALPGQSKELEAVAALQGFQRVPGVVPEMRKLVRGGVGGIVHFAGHGDVMPAPDGSATYAMRLQDDLLDLDVFRGMAGGPGPGAGERGHALYFFNACDIGQADATAGFVDGWAPAVLEAGAAGYVGGLWPLGDAGASQFATTFYGLLDKGLKDKGEVRVAEALREARKAFYDTADPTHLAYVYYGDPNLTFTR